MKHTAVKFLLEKYKSQNTLLFSDDFEQAKEIEKQQIIDAHFEGVKETVLNLSEHINIPITLKNIQEIENGIGKHEEAEQYYNETFKNK
jgi:hypothetical protein